MSGALDSHKVARPAVADERRAHQVVSSCADCPSCTRLTSKKYFCSRLGYKMFDALGKPMHFPDWCPLAPMAAQPVGREALSGSERAELEHLRTLVNTPELQSFRDGVVLEAAHQRERWGSAHDAGKQPADWFWLVGYLAGKALHAQTSGNTEKALHHTISTAAALANWHAAITGEHTAMRPGIDPAAHGITGEGG